jgi:hypothetical protein
MDLLLCEYARLGVRIVNREYHVEREPRVSLLLAQHLAQQAAQRVDVGVRGSGSGSRSAIAVILAAHVTKRRALGRRSRPRQ